VHRGLLVLGLAATLASPGHTEEATLRFRLVESRNAETLERDLRHTAEQRFRLLATSQAGTIDGKPRLVALMERSPPGTDLYEYAVLAPAGNLEDQETLEALNALGAAGYCLGPETIITRTIDDWWLPERSYDAQLTLVLERSAAAVRYAYDSIRFNNSNAFQEQLADRRGDGFKVLALVNSARRVRAILGRPLDLPQPEAGPPRQRFRLLFNARRHGMRKALNRSGAQGYRVVAATEMSILAPAMVLLELPATPPEAYAYKVLSKPVIKHGKHKLEQKLNRRAAQGYRLVPAGLTRTDLTMEQPSGDDTQAWEYRVLSSREPPGLALALDDAIGRGYRFVALFADAIETVAIVEAPTTSPVKGTHESRKADRADRAAH
jgi:hypothetical protein